MTYCPRRSTILQNFSPIARTMVEICVTKVFHFLAPGGLIPGPNFTKRGEDLAVDEVYHLAKFHCSMPTHVRDILYKKSCGHTHTHTHKKQYTIYPQHAYRHVWITNKYTSCPNWRISPHADRRHHSCKRYFWQCIFRYKIQSTLSTILRQ